jgi:Tol biopolymer transport system component
LVTVQLEQAFNIWLVPVEDPTSARQITKGRLFGSTGLSWTPEGSIIFAQEDIRHEAQLWITSTDGSPPRQLSPEGVLEGNPSVCRDSGHLLYLSYRAGTPHIWRSKLDGTDAMQLTEGEGEFSASCSPDGTWFTYFNSDPNGEGVWKMSIEGGNPVRLWERAAINQISPDGKLILIADGQKAMLFPADGEEPDYTYDLSPEWGSLRGWTPDGKAFLYVKSIDGVSNVWQRNMDGSEPKQLTRFDSELINGVDLSPDGKYLAVARNSTTSDVVLIKDLDAN